VLTWLGLLAALRILFELVYDYFVVLANTRVVLVVQILWFVALVPALYFGATAGGAAGAAAAALAVAAGVVAPVYLYELSRTGVTPAAVGRRLVPATVAGLGVAAVAVLAAELIALDIVAVLVAGAGAGAALVLLLYLMRGEVRALRSVGTPTPAREAAAAPA
jgi:PST family polysaccharide transporter